ncbi:VOC family protein [Pseudonocardia sp. GCM10023141]|uniref:VOC family protein n=1 Tax=Pseudonocardia sp. GCM10023141 TaxID=3252653 RepID=UPI0036D2CCC5
MGVPNVAATAAYYADFGLADETDGWFSTRDGGRQLRVVATPSRRLVELTVGVDDPDDLGRAAVGLTRLGVGSERTATTLAADDPATGLRTVLQVAPRVNQPETPAPIYNGPGRIDRVGARTPGVLRTDRVTPRKLGHAVLGSTDLTTTVRFLVEGLGFQISDHIKDEGAFLRCSQDHHNVLVLRAPVTFLHHTAWQVDDVDDVGRGAFDMLDGHPERHVWGLGRHFAGSNFFWYLKDPAGNFSEYYSDMDSIVDDQLWSPEVLEGAKGLFAWGPQPPPSFLRPDDLAALMVGVHAPT